jgi:DNA-binding NarL/FixJ family response regulator
MDDSWTQKEFELVAARMGGELTREEITSLACVARGLSVSQEAELLALEIETVKIRRKRIVSKLGTRSLAAAVSLLKSGGRVLTDEALTPGPRSRLSHLAERVLA